MPTHPTKPAPAPGGSADTPAMRQHRALKAQHPGCILFMRMGDFYELFFDDAVAMSRALGLTLTERPAGVPMAGVPHHQLPVYLKRAVEQGFRVAVADQVEDPALAKGVVERAVTGVFTPGTLVDESLVPEDRPTPLAAVCFAEASAHAAVVDLSTGAFTIVDARDGAGLLDDLARFGVGEVLYAETADGRVPAGVAALVEALGASATARAAWHFRGEEAMEAVRGQFKVAGVEGFGLGADDPAIPAVGAVLRYLSETQAIGVGPGQAASGSEFHSQARTLAHLRPPVREAAHGRCTIDAVSLRSLEIEHTLRSGQVEGSLLGVFLRPAGTTRALFGTPMGRRLIRQWLCAPLADVDRIVARQNGVRVLVDDESLARALGAALAGVQDVARIAGRIALGRATPRDLVALAGSVGRIDALIDATAHTPALAEVHGQLVCLRGVLAPVAARIAAACVDAPPAHLREGGLIRDGVDAELDEARSLQRDAGAWLADYQARLIAEHDLPSLKVGYNKVFGYYIELPAAQARRAPDLFSRRQTLKNAERYITPELKTFEDKVTTAEARALERERRLFADLCALAAGVVPELGRYADAVAHLDVLLGLAGKARARGWVCPDITDSGALSIQGGRHPVLDEVGLVRFVPNDLELGAAGCDGARLALITGPNMAGKSTFIRQTALLVLLAQIGSFIPADRAVIGIVDRIFTRVGADDALHRGQSTFMVEMTETANILNNATARSLVILDEIGRGTSTLDGLSLAWAIAENLAHLGARTLFATHYHEITDLEDRLPGRVRNLHVAVREWETADGRHEIVFLHEIRPGRTDQSYGVHVARLAGVPETVTRRAREILGTLAVHHNSAPRAGKPRRTAATGATAGDAAQMGLFADKPHPAVEQLRELKIESLTPLQAFDLLRQLIDRARD
ncbi:MAG: DNA mismatch repair protein MutS [Phycisphaerales bacterium]|nr:DNA mismatch repair protein MutS [Phycisphaerales bacterium]